MYVRMHLQRPEGEREKLGLAYSLMTHDVRFDMNTTLDGETIALSASTVTLSHTHNNSPSIHEQTHTTQSKVKPRTRERKKEKGDFLPQ